MPGTREILIPASRPAVKDDVNREALLSLRLEGRPADYAGFGLDGMLAAADLKLNVRPRAIQWRERD